MKWRIEKEQLLRGPCEREGVGFVVTLNRSAT
jgi:hypothetical protein